MGTAAGFTNNFMCPFRSNIEYRDALLLVIALDDLNFFLFKLRSVNIPRISRMIIVVRPYPIDLPRIAKALNRIDLDPRLSILIW